jgi:hypothetical protein
MSTMFSGGGRFRRWGASILMSRTGRPVAHRESGKQQRRSVEREQYLSYMLHEGVSKQRVRRIAAILLNVMRLMDVTSLRVVTIEEIDKGSQRWLTDTESHKTRQPGTSSAYRSGTPQEGDSGFTVSSNILLYLPIRS